MSEVEVGWVNFTVERRDLAGGEEGTAGDQFAEGFLNGPSFVFESGGEVVEEFGM